MLATVLSAVPKMATARRRIGVEQLLSWAYRDELPKLERPELRSVGGSAISTLISYGTIVSGSGTPSYQLASSRPDPDALAVDEAVQALAPVGVDWPASRADLLGDYAAMVPEDDPVMMALTIDPRPLIVLHARMGNRPPWGDGETFRAQRVLGRNGKPIVVGVGAGRRYEAGAHCLVDWSMDWRRLAIDRAEYVVWRESLVELASALQLSRWLVGAPDTPALPWVAGAPAPRIWEAA